MPKHEQEAPTFIVDDLTQWAQQGYWAEATQGIFTASLALLPKREVSLGYVLTQQLYDRTTVGGKMGRRQEVQGKALLAALEQHVREALLAAGWRTETHTFKHHFKPVEIWILDEPTIDSSEQLSVSEPTPPSAAEQVNQVVTVRSGGGGQQAEETTYQRTVHTRLITFTCAQCGQTVTQPHFPSPQVLYCSDSCKAEARRAKTRLRVQRLRDRRRKKSTSE